ncbi:MAG: hypothetical protein SPG61_01975 [Arcanobacterium sp.]|nr:hypothetical protein [Arcanobacterium sp.]
MTFSQWINGITYRLFNIWQLIGLLAAFQIIYFILFEIAGFSLFQGTLYSFCFTTLSVNVVIDVLTKKLIIFWTNLSLLSSLLILSIAIAEEQVFLSLGNFSQFFFIGFALFILWWFLPRGIGRGDLRILFVLYFLSPIYGWWLILLIFGIAAGEVLIFYSLQYLIRQKTVGEIPFSPFLVATAIVTLSLLK